MPFSPMLSAFVWLTFASMVVFSIIVLRQPTLRQVIHTVLARPLMQAILMIVLAGMTSAFLSAIPLERQGRTDTLLQATIEATGAGQPEERASVPFATHDEAGEPLKYAGQKLKVGSSKTVHITKYSLVAAIAGGVTSFLHPFYGRHFRCTTSSIAYRRHSDALKLLLASCHAHRGCDLDGDNVVTPSVA